MTKTEDPGPKTSEVAAIILAAGRSRRMGAFKPLLAFGPKTVIETCIENIRSGGVDTVVVVVGRDQRAEELRAHLQNTTVSFATNPDPESEMSASIACGVRALAAPTKAVIINPVDYAAVPGEVVRILISEWKMGGRLIKPTCNQCGGHPVLVDLKFRDELLSLDSNRGLQSLFSNNREQVTSVAVNSNYIARDMDTWDDYAALHQEVFGFPAPDLSFPNRAKDIQG